jgi:hypothetical protein
MSVAMSPYREAATIGVEEKVPVKRTGLIPAVPPPPPHVCNWPKTYVETTILTKKRLFFFTKKIVTETKRDVIKGSLYRCPDCLKVALFDRESEEMRDRWRDPYWHPSKKANDMWLEKTGEFVDGEP